MSDLLEEGQEGRGTGVPEFLGRPRGSHRRDGEDQARQGERGP